jgi:SAM-dependent methyltransferase
MKLSRAARKGFGLLTSAKLRRQALNAVDGYLKLPPMECPICGFVGKFTSSADTPIGSVCAGCGCWDRHRLLALALQRGFFTIAGKNVLNCSPEIEPWDIVDRAQPSSHRRIARRRGHGGVELFIEQIALPDDSIDAIVAVHSFEHACDDRKALAEAFRVLKPGGQLIAMVPLIEGWAETYEDASVASDAERHLYYGLSDHVRYYGADFRRRIGEAGFALAEFTAGPRDSVRYGLARGEKVFVGTK